jgi:hypothetical protein
MIQHKRPTAPKLATSTWQSNTPNYVPRLRMTIADSLSSTLANE